MGDGAIKWRVPAEVIGTEGANGADGGAGGILENGGEAGDAGFGDGFKDDAGLVEADLRATAVDAVRDLDTEGGGFIGGFVGNFFAG